MRPSDDDTACSTHLVAATTAHLQGILEVQRACYDEFFYESAEAFLSIIREGTSVVLVDGAHVIGYGLAHEITDHLDPPALDVPLPGSIPTRCSSSGLSSMCESEPSIGIATSSHFTTSRSSSAQVSGSIGPDHAFPSSGRGHHSTPLKTPALRPRSPAFFLHDISIHPAHREKGLASQIAAALLQKAVDARYQYATLIAVQGSVPFWRKFGFHQAEGYELPPRLRESYGNDACLMVKKLTGHHHH